MASQRKHKKKQKRHGRFAWIFQLLALVTLIGAATVGVTVFFKVEQVEVVGNAHYTPDELVTASGIYMEDNLFLLNLDAIETSMEGALPYLEEVEATRQLPNGIRLTVQEWDAIGYVETYSGNWLISVGGKVLEKGDSAPICISGLDVLLPSAGSFIALEQAETDKKASLLDLLAELERRDVLNLVSSIDLSSATSITMEYDGRFTVILPMSGDYDYELQALEEAIGYQTEHAAGTFDMTQQGYTAVFSPN